MHKQIGTLAKEFEGALLGDARRSARLLRIVETLERDPSSGFPQALESAAELEGFYRFINNDGFDPGEVLEPHRRATLERARSAKEVVIVHDTTTVEYRGESTREGLGYTTALGRQGFMAHAALAIDAATALPLGVANLETYTRCGRTWRTRQRRDSVKGAPAARESGRWLRGVDAAEQLDGLFTAIHVMDAEADFFELLAHLHVRSARYVIRAGQLDRRISDDAAAHLRDAVRDLKPAAFRNVPLSERGTSGKTRRACNSLKKHPPRKARIARVAISGTTVRLPKTRYTDIVSEDLVVNVVRVWEPRPRAGEPPVEWVLLTSDPIATVADLERVVDRYRMRWTIEDYFKALKTGCALERRQMESYDSLRKVLAILAPIAWRLLYLRGLTRQAPKAPAAHAFSDLELQLLTRAPATRGCRPPRTVSDGLALLARLGGHLKSNGPPGWLTLGRGYEKLLLLRIGWELAVDYQRRSDQS